MDPQDKITLNSPLGIADPDKFYVVLCGTQGPGNLGSVCRAMKAMGLRHLVLVSPLPSAINPPLIKEMAIHAYDIYENAQYHDTLEEALKNYQLSAAFARRQGGKRKTGFLELPEFTHQLKNRLGPIALVFGNERSGLSPAEVGACTLSVQIPTHPDFPSLNLAQAVQIACWELRQIPRDKTRAVSLQMGTRAKTSSLSQGEASDLANQVLESFEHLGFYKNGGREKAQETWRDIFSRAGIDKTESQWILGTFGKIRSLKTSD